jgi:hypothetical protein
MKFRTYMLIAAIIAVLYGLGFLFIPNTVMGLYGVKLNEPGRYVALYFGSALMGIAVTWWRIRESKTVHDLLEGVFLGGIVLSVTGLVVALLDAIAGPSNNIAWINPVIYAFLTIGFVYLYFKKME